MTLRARPTSDVSTPPPRRRQTIATVHVPWWGAWSLVGIVGVTTLIALIGLNSPIVDHAVFFVTLRTVACVGLVAVALVVLARGSGTALAALLIVIAYALAITGLTGANAPVPFAIGRIAVPVPVLLVIFFCLAYPATRIDDRLARRVFVAVAAVLVVLDVANILLADAPPVAGPFVRCAGSACPSNPFNVVSLGHGPSRVLSGALGLAISVAAFAAAALIARRAARSTRLQRRSLAPLFAWTVLTGLGYGFFLAVRAVDGQARVLTPAAIVVAAIIATLPLAIGLGMARGRWFAMSALETMLARLGEQPTLAGLQRTMARAFADPSLQLLSWRPSLQRYVDVEGAPVEDPALDPRSQVTEFGQGGAKLAAIVHDPVLAADPVVLAAAGRALRLALDNDRLHTDLTTSIAELEASRKRVASAADEERRRIERDLHDGAQQDLIALRIKLGLLEELAGEDGSSVARAIADAGERVDTAIDRIRDLARGIYPGVLRDFGLADAIAAVARKLPLEIAVHAHTRQRFAPEVETAVYFCCVEALQNAAKHCPPDTRVELGISDRPAGLAFTIEDDGPGFDPMLLTTARGLTGMRDRIEAIGGALTISTSPGMGTTITGRVDATPL